MANPGEAGGPPSRGEGGLGAMIRRLCAAYVAGAVAAVLSSGQLWAAGSARLPEMLGVELAPALTWSWVAPRLLAGSFYALPYPFLRKGLSPLRAAFIVSLLPTAIELFWLLPQQGHGLLGLSLGGLAFAVVMISNAVWAFLLVQVIRAMRGLGPVLT